MVDEELTRIFLFEDKVIQGNGGAISTNHCHDCEFSEASWLVAPDRNNYFFSVCTLCVVCLVCMADDWCLCVCLVCCVCHMLRVLCVVCVVGCACLMCCMCILN